MDKLKRWDGTKWVEVANVNRYTGSTGELLQFKEHTRDPITAFFQEFKIEEVLQNV